MGSQQARTQRRSCADSGFLAHSAAMLRVAEALERAADTDVRVVLYGEPGVGKSHAARCIHQLSPRRAAPLRGLSVRDASAGQDLADPEFIASVNGGTLILEGVDEAAPAVQAALVGAIEEWVLQEEDGEATVRVVATCGSSLSAGVMDNRFRNDLYYLLEVFPVYLPPLRERAEEIPAFVELFARRHAPDWPWPIPLPASFVEEAMGYAWPGNLRELENLVIQACPRAGEGEWRFPQTLHGGEGLGLLPFQKAKREFERSYVSRLLLATGGNVTRSAELAGKARKDFYALMARNKIDPAKFRAGSKG